MAASTSPSSRWRRIARRADAPASSTDVTCAPCFLSLRFRLAVFFRRNSDDTIGTPTLQNAKVAGWYDRGPTPGEVGSAIMDAHVDSALMSDYRGAFYYLGLTKPGMQVDITRADHTVAVFTIDEVQASLKSDFPTQKVYAATNYPALRLITCGGDFDKKTHEYLGNTIVYAHLTAEH